MKTLKIAVPFSGSASSLRYLHDTDPNYGKTYQIVCGLANKKRTMGEKFCLDNGINFAHLNTKDFCLSHGYEGKICDMPESTRREYYTMMSYLLGEYEPDLILLSGFMLKITPPLLGSVPIINVHPADLTIINGLGKPKYTGDDAVTLAIQAGEKSTASTIHVVVEEVDCGRIICVSDHLAVEDGSSPQSHQEKMKTMCDGPAYQKALELITSGAFKF